MKDCIFCQIRKIESDILFKSNNFFVKVGVGILAPGHVMIVPKKHISCFGELPKQLNKEFILIKNQVIDRIKSNISDPIIYEHGIYNQSISHAHLHFVPAKNEYYHLQNIKEKLFRGSKSTQISSMSQLVDIFRKEGSYIYLEEMGKKWIFHTKGQPEGKFTFRKEFARLTGSHSIVKWQTMTEEEKLRDKMWTDLTKNFLNETTP